MEVGYGPSTHAGTGHHPRGRSGGERPPHRPMHTLPPASQHPSSLTRNSSGCWFLGSHWSKAARGALVPQNISAQTYDIWLGWAALGAGTCVPWPVLYGSPGAPMAKAHNPRGCQHRNPLVGLESRCGRPRFLWGLQGRVTLPPPLLAPQAPFQSPLHPHRLLPYICVCCFSSRDACHWRRRPP